MYSERLEQAVRSYWSVRKESTVRGGKQLDALAELVAEIFIEEGFPEKSIQRGASLELPGYYRPEKKWGSGSIMGDREIVAVQKEPQADLVHPIRLGERETLSHETRKPLP